MEDLPLLILLFVAAAFSVGKLYHWLFSSEDDLYSVYRNTIDHSPEHFKKRLKQKRLLWGVLAVVAIVATFYKL